MRQRSKDELKAIHAKSGGKSYRRNYDDKPSFYTKHMISSDVKRMHRHDDPEQPREHGAEVDLYKRRLSLQADQKHLKESKKSHKIQKKLIKREEKQAKKNVKKGYAEDNQDAENTREGIEKVEGN